MNGPGAFPQAGHRQPDNTATAEELGAEIWALELELIRVIRDDRMLAADRRRAVTALLARARSSAEPELTCRAMEWAIGRDLDELTEGEVGYGDPVERRLEQLHRSGETTCGRCLRPVPGRETIAWWRARRLAATWRPERRAS